MNAVQSVSGPSVGVARWAARVLGTGLFLFWGAFFLAHLEWFRDPRQLPPPWVIGVYGLHFLMLLGFLLAWRWELLGGVLILASALPFFAVASRNFALYAGVTAVPAVLWLYCGWQARRRRGEVSP